jgi:Maltose acetyltransferase
MRRRGCVINSSPTLNRLRQLLPGDILESVPSSIMDLGPEWGKAQRGELYRAFVPELIAVRDKCKQATDTFNRTPDTSRRNLVKLWRE